MKSSAEDFLSKFSELIGLELERGLLEYDQLGVANQVASAEVLKLVDLAKGARKSNKVGVSFSNSNLFSIPCWIYSTAVAELLLSNIYTGMIYVLVLRRIYMHSTRFRARRQN